MNDQLQGSTYEDFLPYMQDEEQRALIDREEFEMCMSGQEEKELLRDADDTMRRY